MDVKITFLHSDLHKRSIWIIQKVLKFQERKPRLQVQKELVGLKYTPRQLYKKFDSFIVS